MFSTPQIAIGLVLLASGACYWILRGFDRRSLSTQVSQAIEALDRSTLYWLNKHDEPDMKAYARTRIMCNLGDRAKLKAMQIRLAAGERLTVKQVLRLEKLVAEHLVEQSTEAPAPIAVYGR